MKLLKLKYKIVPFCEVSKSCEPFLILRHDVDASLEAALKMARIEADLSIRSTYFVLFSHKLYNLLEKDSLTTLREILGLGHEIGLHYHVETYESYGQDLGKTLENEIRLLERLLSRKVFSIARHNASTMSGEDPFQDVTEYINASNPRFRKHYVSDSCRAWTTEDLSRLLSFRCKRVQLLTHPFLWTEEKCLRGVVLERLFRDIENRNRAYESGWLNLWHNSPKVRRYDKLIGASN